MSVLDPVEVPVSAVLLNCILFSKLFLVSKVDDELGGIVDSNCYWVAPPRYGFGCVVVVDCEPPLSDVAADDSEGVSCN